MKKTALILAIVLCIAVCATVLAACKPNLPAQKDPIADNYRVFYQIFVGSFSDSNGDGYGDIRGIINRMDYLNDGNINSGKSLGVQGLWLSPIFKSPTYHKYDATDYYQIDPKFGTDEDLKELIDICHQRNVKIILDLAINHTAKNNQWYKNFEKAHQDDNPNDKYYDYYSWAFSDTRLSGHTYYGIAGCKAEYYEGNFDSGMPELNFDNADVRQEVLAVGKHYLDMGIDGFRFDAVKYIYYNETSRSAEFLKWYTDELRKIKPDAYFVGECWSSDSEILEYYKALNCFSFDAGQVSGTIAAAASRGQISTFTKHVESFNSRAKAINADAMFVPFIANHDTDRAVGYLPLKSMDGDGNEINPAYMAANIYLLCSGSPIIYYGEEIGMQGSRGASNTDANRRLAMLWGDGDKVQDPTGATYSRDNQQNGTVAEQLKDKKSLLNYYAKVINLRTKYPQIARGECKSVEAASGCAGFVITYNGEQTLLLHNVSASDVKVDISLLGNFTQLCDYVGMGNAKLKGTTLTIKAQTSAICK